MFPENLGQQSPVLIYLLFTALIIDWDTYGQSLNLTLENCNINKYTYCNFRGLSVSFDETIFRAGKAIICKETKLTWDAKVIISKTIEISKNVPA